MKRIDSADFEEARDLFMGWCSTCEAFTREETEPDAEGYDCPACGENTVMGAENALLTGQFSFNEGGEGREEVDSGGVGHERVAGEAADPSRAQPLPGANEGSNE